MPKATSFKKVVLCHTNDFPSNINDRIRGWVEANGGKFSRELTSEVTHLVASRKAWKRYSATVKAARQMRTVRIVKYDWLEDSLTKRPCRALPEKNYLFEQTKLKTLKRVKKLARGTADDGDESPNKINIARDKHINPTGIEFDKATKDFQEDMDEVGFHPYADKTGFVYIVSLVRFDRSRRRLERYRLKLYESDHLPRSYACYAQYTRPGVQKQILQLAPPGSTWDFAWHTFEIFYKGKARTSWDERPANGTEITIEDEKDEEGNEFDQKDEPFFYQAPKIGQPSGIRATDVVNDVTEAVETQPTLWSLETTTCLTPSNDELPDELPDKIQENPPVNTE